MPMEGPRDDSRGSAGIGQRLKLPTGAGVEEDEGQIGEEAGRGERLSLLVGCSLSTGVSERCASETGSAQSLTAPLRKMAGKASSDPPALLPLPDVATRLCCPPGCVLTTPCSPALLRCPGARMNPSAAAVRYTGFSQGGTMSRRSSLSSPSPVIAPTYFESPPRRPQPEARPHEPAYRHVVPTIHGRRLILYLASALALLLLLSEMRPRRTASYAEDEEVARFDEADWHSRRSAISSRPQRTFAWRRPSSKLPRAIYGTNITFTDFLNTHFPLSDPQPPHIWITLADELFAETGAANLQTFVDQLNAERRHKYKGKKRETRLVTLCLEDGCVEECARRGMYAYGGYEKTRPKQILKATWPKLASLIDTLQHRDVFFIDADISFAQDPYPHMEPLMEKYDIIAQENDAFEHFNSGWMWLRQGKRVVEAWKEVFAMDMKKTSRDQYNFNEVLGTHDQRKHTDDPDDPYHRPLRSSFTAKNGLKVHVLDSRLFRTYHQRKDAWVAHHDSLYLHMTCADDSWLKLFVPKSEGFWTDVDEYYSQPPALLSIHTLSGPREDLVQQWRILMGAAYYSERALSLPSYSVVTDLRNGTAIRDTYSTFPLSHVAGAGKDSNLGVEIVESDYAAHATAHLLGVSALNSTERRNDGWWEKLGAKERKRREDAVVALTKVAELDMRQVESFPALIQRLRDDPTFSSASHIQLMNFEHPAADSWRSWDFPTPINRATTCGDLHEPPTCTRICPPNGENWGFELKAKWPSVKGLLADLPPLAPSEVEV
ncbi:hypothetical protein OF846_001270 [Rhodotorula toruloides]|nr:hypothetical protein OF846_001270 [Rhodotorula toruloides]